MEEKNTKRWIYMTLVNLAVLVMPMVLGGCRSKYFQPKEPEGYEKFVETVANISRNTSI